MDRQSPVLYGVRLGSAI